MERHYLFLNHLLDLLTPTNSDTWFYCTGAKRNKSTNNSWYLIIQVTQVRNCPATYKKALECWDFWWTVSIRLHALAFCLNGDKDLSPGRPGLSQFKGPWQGFVSRRNVLHSPLNGLKRYCWGTALAVHTIKWHPQAPKIPHVNKSHHSWIMKSKLGNITL